MKFILNILLSFYQKIDSVITYLFSNNLNEKKFILENTDTNHNHKIVIFDVGSNLGNFSKYISKILKSHDLEFHLFEPDPITFKLLKKRNKLLNVKLNNMAILDSDGYIDFFRNEISSQSSINENHSTIPSKSEKIQVKSIRLDKYIEINKIEYIDILKIDVEGSEKKVIDSIGSILKQNRIKLIRIEIRLFNSNDFYSIINTFKENNYELKGFKSIKYHQNSILFLDAYFKLLVLWKY